jgi:hypothetical protein
MAWPRDMASPHAPLLTGQDRVVQAMTDLQAAADKGLLIGVPLPAKTGKERARINDLMKEVGCDPFRIMAQVAMGQEVCGHIPELSDIIECSKELAGYMAPKLKAIEHVDVTKVAGGVMLIPAPVSMDEWARIVEANKVKTIEAEVVK